MLQYVKGNVSAGRTSGCESHSKVMRKVKASRHQLGYKNVIECENKMRKKVAENVLGSREVSAVTLQKVRSSRKLSGFKVI